MSGIVSHILNKMGLDVDRRMRMSNCDMCVNYVYDADYECYTCLVNLDEDEMYRFLSGNQNECPYFRLDDEYGVVRHQI